MRKIAANYIFPVTSGPLKNGIIAVDEDGTICDIQSRAHFQEEAGLEYYNGILIPGFVNAYGSIRMGLIRRTSDVSASLYDLIARWNNVMQQPLENADIKKWEKLLYSRGISAMGDVVGASQTMESAKKQALRFHYFLTLADRSIQNIPQETAKASNGRAHCSLCPYAGYTLPNSILKALAEHADQNNKPLAVSNQRFRSENELFLKKSGELYRRMRQAGHDFSTFLPTGRGSLESLLPFLPAHANIILAFNTFTTLNEIQLTETTSKKIYWILCPSSEKAAGNPMPDFTAFYRNEAIVALGTGDAPLSEDTGILNELKLVNYHAPFVPLEELLSWSTLNGAKALRMENTHGSLEPGKKPGILLLKNINLSALKFTQNTEVQRLV